MRGLCEDDLLRAGPLSLVLEHWMTFWFSLFLFIPSGLAAEVFFRVPGVTSTWDSYWILTPGWKEISGVWVGCITEWGLIVSTMDCCLYCLGHLKTEVCGVRKGIEIRENKEEPDLIVCPGLFTNCIRTVILFVGIWIVCLPIVF